jgi:predicted O-methyltransferase YrrM
MSISEYLHHKGCKITEGHCQTESKEVEELIQLTKKQNLKVMEIGFNAGHSAEVFLKNNPSIKLTSFDLGSHDYVLTAKEYIDATFPNRHTLIIGDSTKTVPEFIRNNPNMKFDVIFIDGGHEYNIAKADIENCSHLAHEDTIVILDDTIFTKEWEAHWTIGPSRAWLENLQQNKIVEIERKEYGFGKGMCWGKYLK